MRVFRCDHCHQPVFFENTQCVSCGHVLAYLPDFAEIGSLEPADGVSFTSPLPAAKGRRYRLCRNYVEFQVCNWTVTEDEGEQELCRACRLTRLIPDLGVQGHREAWCRMEVAKRRLLYSLYALGLPVIEKAKDPSGVAFEFLADPLDPAAPRVLTGHGDGVIRINLAEADDAERERRRESLHEPYRTLLGHFRHEIGHYYWDRLIAGSDRLEDFRRLFGDDQRNYDEALQAHYERGAPLDWPVHFVSAYSSSHPWEDWAETWAHYLHMEDTLETAAACGLSLHPADQNAPSLATMRTEVQGTAPFDQMISRWFPITYILNHLNRGMGLADGYPFVLSSEAIEKLRFVHDTIARYREACSTVSGAIDTRRRSSRPREITRRAEHVVERRAGTREKR